MHGLWAQVLKVAAAHMLAVASPGPDFAMVVRQSLAHGRRAAVWTSVGIGTAILLHITYTALGIGLLLRGSPVAFSVVKFSGAAYLAWIGFKALSSRPAPVPNPEPGGEAAVQGQPTPRAAWSAGFLTNALNPKVTLFMVALYASLIDPATPRLVQAAYGIWMSLATMAWFAVVSVLITRASVRRAFLRAGVWIDRVMGLLFIGLAVALAVATAS